jgi:hypothetical protein
MPAAAETMFGHAHIEKAAGVAAGEVERAAGARQIGGQDDDALVVLGQVGQLLPGDEGRDRAGADALLGLPDLVLQRNGAVGAAAEDAGDLLRAGTRAGTGAGARAGRRLAGHERVLAGRSPASISRMTSS